MMGAKVAYTSFGWAVLSFGVLWKLQPSWKHNDMSATQKIFHGLDPAPPFHVFFLSTCIFLAALAVVLMNFCHWIWGALPKWHFGMDVPRCLASLPRLTC